MNRDSRVYAEHIQKSLRLLSDSVRDINDRYTERKAYVKARDGVPIEEDDVIDFCAARLPHYKCPNKVWFVEDIPRGLGGKVIRRLLG